MGIERAYEGGELGLFSKARRWKSYWSAKIRPYIGEAVLEVGAGIGSNTPFLCDSSRRRWVCLEPDSNLAAQIPASLAGYEWSKIVEVQAGTLSNVPPENNFDTLLYIDVLEHIEKDRDELRAALLRLKRGGRIIVLSPAHPWLFTELDKEIGHYRRYTKTSLRNCSPPGSRLIQLFYLDAAGLPASAANKLFLHQSMPTEKQIEFWDNRLVPFSLWIDPLLGFGLGKTVIGIWMKDDSGRA